MTSLSALFEEFKASRLKYPQQRRGAEDAFFGGLVNAINKLKPLEVMAPAHYPAGDPAVMLDYPAPARYLAGDLYPAPKSPESVGLIGGQASRMTIAQTEGHSSAPRVYPEGARQGIVDQPKRRGRPPKVRDDAPPAAPVTEEPNG